MMSKVVTFEEAARLIPDCAVVSISSSSGLNTPDRMLAAIGARFDAEGHPRDLTTLHPIGTGDMYGIKGIDHIARRGLLKRTIAGSYPSGPSSMDSPLIWQMIMANEVEAYNVPSGILFDMHREVAQRRAGVMTRIGLHTFVDPRLEGCRMNEAARDAIVKLVEVDGQEYLHFPNIPTQVAIIRGTTADEIGNISMEHEGSYLGVLDLALAARNCGGIVIAQVKRLTARGSIPMQRAFVPSTLVDYIVVDPGQMQATGTVYDPAISGEVKRRLDEFSPIAFGADKVIARRAALELARGDAVNLGFGISPLVPRILVEEGCSNEVTWAIEQGAVGGVPLDGFPFGCAANAESLIPAPYQFIYLQGGGFDLCMLSFLEVDAEGNVNVSRLGSKPHVTAGAGGFVDITSHARRIVFSGYFRAAGLDLDLTNGKLTIRRDGKFAKFVPSVEHVTFSGRRAREQQQDVTYVTERCVIKLLPEGLTVTEVAPGVDLHRDVLGQAAVALRVAADAKTMDARLFRPQPMDLVLKEARVRAAFVAR
jgi:acyl CoA:acetate/3-ketoacid CoA transferase